MLFRQRDADPEPGQPYFSLLPNTRQAWVLLPGAGAPLGCGDSPPEPPGWQRIQPGRVWPSRHGTSAGAQFGCGGSPPASLFQTLDDGFPIQIGADNHQHTILERSIRVKINPTGGIIHLIPVSFCSRQKALSPQHAPHLRAA